MFGEAPQTARRGRPLPPSDRNQSPRTGERVAAVREKQKIEDDPMPF